MEFIFDYDVQESELENKYQHLHHADALKILELARLDLLVKLGYPIQSFFEKDLFLVISKIEIAYRREIKAGPVRVVSKGLKIQGKEIIIPHYIYNQHH